MARSGSGISAIFASTSLSPSALSLLRARFRLQLLGALLHRGSFLVRESLGLLVGRVVLLADFCVSFFGLIETSVIRLGWKPRRSSNAEPALLAVAPPRPIC